MGFEIERKFLLANSDWKKLSDQGIMIRQGYLNSKIERTVRIRIKGNKGFITVKGKTVKTTRLGKPEYSVPPLPEQGVPVIPEHVVPLLDKLSIY